jgi:iron(III) transport system substrate-binding protein
MIKKALVSLMLLSAVAPAFAAEELNIYSARKEKLIAPILERFAQETGVTINLITGKADALLKRLQLEGKNSPADILITTDAGRLHRAKESGLTASVESEKLSKLVPASYRDSEGHWVGLSLRARPIIYVKDKVDPAELTSYESLADEKWKGRICIRSSNNIYNQSLVASLIAHDGVEATENWAKGLVANFARPPKGGDRDQIKAAAAGQCDIAVANTYYLAGMLTSNDEAEKAAASKVAVFWPNQADRGAHVNVSGAAVLAAAKNKQNAIKLLEFLASDEAQEWYAYVNGEYPVRDGIDVSDTLKSWGEFKKDTLKLDQLGTLNPESVKLMDRAGWK